MDVQIAIDKGGWKLGGGILLNVVSIGFFLFCFLFVFLEGLCFVTCFVLHYIVSFLGSCNHLDEEEKAVCLGRLIVILVSCDLSVFCDSSPWCRGLVCSM